MFLAGLSASTSALAQASGQAGSVERTVPGVPPTTTGIPVTPVIVPPEPIGTDTAPISGSFILGAVSIEGATVFDSATLAQDFEPLLASEVSGVQLGQILDRITERYRAAGYPFSYAMLPEQDVRSGIVRIRVIEGFIDEVRIEGAGRSEPALKALASRLLREVPSRTVTLERVLGLVRDVPGVSVSDVRVRRSASDPSRLAMSIIVSHDPTRGLLYADNRGTEGGARARFYASTTATSTVVAGDRIQVDLFGVPGEGYHLLYGQADASVAIGGDGLRIGTTVSLSDDRQRISGKVYDGSSRNLAPYLTYPVLRTRKVTALGRITINDQQNDGRFDRVLVQRDRLRVLRTGIQLTNAAVTQIVGHIAVSKGLAFDGSTRSGDPLASRPGASSHFAKINFDLQIVRPLSDGLTVRFGAAGQYADGPVLAVEEFALGGSALGRAYDYNSLTGDHGIGAGLELGYQIGNILGVAKQTELFTYIDGGAVFRASPRAGPSDRRGLAGVGGGVRVSLLGLTSSLELGLPLATVNGDDRVRGFVTVAKAF